MGFYKDLIDASWIVWFSIIAIVIFILWIFVGGGNYEYVGLAPLKIGVDSTKYVDEQVYGVIERSNYNAEKISSIDITPKIPPLINNTSAPLLNADTENIINRNNIFSPKFIGRSVEPNIELNLTPIGPIAPFDPSQILPKQGKVCSKGEKMCRKAIEEIYNKPFPNCRPDFLKNPETKRNLELDCYNDELKIAIEYNGIQHYKWPNFTNQSQEDFVKQIRRDKFKVDMCDANGVYLITVPYNVPDNKIKSYIEYYLPENYHKRLTDEKNPNQVYSDLIDYNKDHNFDGIEYSEEYEDDYSDEYSKEDSDKLTDEHSDEDISKYSDDNLCSALFSEQDDDILKSYEVSLITKH
jgi:hypothetical protein